MTSRGGPHDVASAWRTAFDLFVYAPIGLGAMLIEDGPAAIERARQELRNARFIGRLTVDQGVAQMRRRLDTEPGSREQTTDARSAAVTVSADATDTVATSADASATGVEADASETSRLAADPAPPSPPDDLPVASDLALPDYDTLPAIDIVAKLDTLGTDEREAIERYESAHRQRRTVLGKLARLGAA